MLSEPGIVGGLWTRKMSRLTNDLSQISTFRFLAQPRRAYYYVVLAVSLVRDNLFRLAMNGSPTG